MADWIFRAIQSRRRPRITIMRHWDTGRSADQFGEQQLAATVVCRDCNNGWIGTLDKRASELLKPLICNTGAVRLNAGEQSAVAAWALKTVIVNDLPLTGGKSELLQCAADLRTSQLPPQFIQVWAGPPSLALNGDTRCIGVVPQHGELQLGTGPNAERITLHVWRLMLGYLDLLVRPTLMWIPLPDPQDFVRIFPSPSPTVTLSPLRQAQGAVRWSEMPPGMTMDDSRGQSVSTSGDSPSPGPPTSAEADS
jgi:hypothetical protein